MTNLLSKIQALQAHCAQEPGYFKVLEELLDVLAMIREGDSKTIEDILDWYIPDDGEEYMADCLKRLQAACALMEADK